MSYMNIFLSGNFQYDAGVLGFLKVLERFYPAQYEVSGGELKFTRKVLDDFNLSWFKMILLQSDIFNNSIYRPNAKKRQNKRYRDEIKKVISHITKNGKSPFYLHTCKNGHVFTVTLSYDKSAEKLYVRDISPVLKPDETSSNLSNSNKKDDWIKRHFG
ncbi:MAG: hypothetical protein ACP6IS_11500 [Candidatus Asgardarchaeia archaeon]